MASSSLNYEELGAAGLAEGWLVEEEPSFQAKALLDSFGQTDQVDVAVGGIQPGPYVGWTDGFVYDHCSDSRVHCELI